MMEGAPELKLNLPCGQGGTVAPRLAKGSMAPSLTG